MTKKVLLFLFLMLFCIKNAFAVEILQKMDVKIGVFDAAQVDFWYKNESDNKFLIKTNVNTANFFASVYPFIGKYSSYGIFVDEGVRAKLYENQTESRNHVRTKKILYDENGVAYLRISTKDDYKREFPIMNVPDTANVADLQTIFAELINDFAKNRVCNLVREVYDGKKHYKVVVEDKGIENRYFDWQKATIPAYKCSMYIQNLKENNDNILWDVTSETPINFWLGINKMTNLPYVLEIKIDSTPLGALQVTPSNLDTK